MERRGERFFYLTIFRRPGARLKFGHTFILHLQCVFITAGPITKLFAGGEEESGGGTTLNHCHPNEEFGTVRLVRPRVIDPGEPVGKKWYKGFCARNKRLL